jgi:hypothetical protein
VRRDPPAAATVPLPPELAGRPLDGVVRALFHLSWNAARARIRNGKIFIDGAAVTDPRFVPPAGAALRLRAQRRRRSSRPICPSAMASMSARRREASAMPAGSR